MKRKPCGAGGTCGSSTARSAHSFGFGSISCFSTAALGAWCIYGPRLRNRRTRAEIIWGFADRIWEWLSLS